MQTGNGCIRTLYISVLVLKDAQVQLQMLLVESLIIVVVQYVSHTLHK